MKFSGGPVDDGNFSNALNMLSIKDMESMKVDKYGPSVESTTGLLSLLVGGVAHNEHRLAKFSNEDMNVTAEELPGR